MKLKRYPVRYHYRGRDNTDGPFIRARMDVLPDDMRHEVSEQYERLYKSGGSDNRKAANTYLHELAKPYRDQLRKRTPPKADATSTGAQDSALVNRVEAMRQKAQAGARGRDSIMRY